MTLFLSILFIQIFVGVKLSLSVKGNTELSDLLQVFNHMVVKQGEMEKQIDQMRIKNEDMVLKQKNMEIQMTRLQFVHTNERRYLYNKLEVVEKQLHKLQRQNSHLRKAVLEFRTNHKGSKTSMKLKSASIQKQYGRNGIIKFHQPILKHIFAHSKCLTGYNMTKHKSTPSDAFSDTPLHGNIASSYGDGEQNIGKRMTKKEKTKRTVSTASSETVVAFQARPSIDIANVGDNQHLEFDRVIFSEGPDYDKATGTFCCVIPGVYVFSVTILTEPNKFLQVTIVRNGGSLAHLSSYNDNHHGSGTNMAIVRLGVGDRVWVRVNAARHHSGTVLNNAFTTFSGFLLQRALLLHLSSYTVYFTLEMQFIYCST